MFYWFAYCIVWIFGRIFFPFTAKGCENIPPQGGFIFASNHLSYIDPLLIGLSARRKISYMARDSLFRNKIFGFLLRKVNTFPVKRGGADIGALREALRRLKGGSPLVIFPEGTRKGKRTEASDSDNSVHPGIAFLAARSEVPVVPVYITGADKVLPPGSKWFKRHPITVTFGPSVVFSKHDSYTQIAQEIMGRIHSLE